MKNVIDLTRRLKKKSGKKTGNKSAASAPVIDMTEKRNEIISQERRQVRRTILSQFIGAFALVPRKGLLKVVLYDISEQGLAFDVDAEAGHFAMGEEIAMRVYLNHKTYFPFVVKVQNIRAILDDGTYRHGVNFVKDTINEVALHHFVRFIETVSASLEQDNGDMVASNLVR
ncbi:MAG: PilZ domain-containing protein [Bdellovibrionales bacterium]